MSRRKVINFDWDTPARKLQRKPAGYDPHGKPICPECFSKPDIDWGKGRGKGPSSLPKGWNFSTRGSGEDEIAVVHYRCSNPSCGTLLRIEYMHSDFGNYVYTPDQIVSEEKYYSGGHDGTGIWKEGLAPKDVEVATEPEGVPELVVEEQGPWVYIDYPPLADRFPKHWTRDGQRIKVRQGTAQYDKIVTWFEGRGLWLRR